MSENALSLIEIKNPLQVFVANGLDPYIERIRAEVKSLDLDISTERGRREIASAARKVASSKVALDEMGKALVADLKAQTGAIDAERKRMRDALDKLRDETRAPLTEWEEKNEARCAGHEAAIAEIAALSSDLDNLDVAGLERRIARSVEISGSRNWEEFAHRASAAHNETYGILVRKIEARRKYEAEQAELERLRAEEAARKQKEHEERIATEAAAKAKAEAEAQAREAAGAEAARVKAEMEKAEQSRLAIEREKQAADERARKAEADRLAAEEKAQQDAIAAEQKAKRDQEEAVRRERERAEAEKRAEAEAAAKREADKQHRAKINNEALAVLLNVLAGDNLLTADAAAKAVIKAIAKGEIPHVKINY